MFVAARRRTLRVLTRRYGRVFTLRLPLFGDCVVVADPTLAKQVFTTSTDELSNIKPNLSRILGPGSMFALDGRPHRTRRKLLTPPLHGKRIAGYERVVEEEFRAEAASWPMGERFAILEPMNRITLNVILRTVFGAQGADLDDLRELIPPMVTAGSRLATVPELPGPLSRVGPKRRFLERRARYNTIIGRLIDTARRDPDLADRNDILSLMVASRYDDGSSMTDRDITDELLTLLVAGHETTATTLAWAVERLQRSPAVLSRLVAEVDDNGTDLRTATILETQRARPVIDFAGRHVDADSVTLGDHRIEHGHNIWVSISLLHDDSREFSDPDLFDPDRFVGHPPSAAWVPFGGGTRRCIGAAFAHMEMDVVLRTLLRDFVVEPTDAKAEAWHSRGVASAPRRGGQVTLHSRT